MILRNVAIRHGRKALAAPLRRPFLRSLTTETESIPQEAEAVSHSIENHPNENHFIEANINQLNMAPTFGSSGRAAAAAAAAAAADVVSRHNLVKTIKKRTHKLGSVISHYYEPSELLLNPRGPKDISLELLMASQAHLGHSTSLWNPANQRYILGIRQGVHIIALETTAAHLRRAAKVVEGVAYHGGLILFVGTRPGQRTCVVKAAEMAKGCHLFQRWIPGSITNRDQILNRCTIKAIDKDDNEVPGFEEKIGEWSALKPDLVVVLNPLENYLLLHECGLNNIPTIGVIDTDANPTWVTYPIPANDDSLRCIQLIAGILGRAGEDGQRKRLEAAKTGEVTWFPPSGLGSPMTDERRLKAVAEQKEAKRLNKPVVEKPEKKAFDPDDETDEI